MLIHYLPFIARLFNILQYIDFFNPNDKSAIRFPRQIKTPQVP